MICRCGREQVEFSFRSGKRRCIGDIATSVVCRPQELDGSRNKEVTSEQSTLEKVKKKMWCEKEKAVKGVKGPLQQLSKMSGTLL